MGYDIIFLHPPAIYAFSKKAIFPGPIDNTLLNCTPQFIVPPIGMISMAEYLKRNGAKVRIVNLGEYMLLSQSFDVEKFIKGNYANVFAIDLHWCNHSQGAIEIAKICKRLHPNSFVVLGGLTASCFALEILQKFPFIDAVVRGEGEEVILKFLNSFKLDNVPNLAYRKDKKIIVNPIELIAQDLDKYEFAVPELLEPGNLSTTGLSPDGKIVKWWGIPICRGCAYLCHHCGGSSLSYDSLFNRKKIVFRSPKKIVEDLNKLVERGFKNIFLFQDPRMGGPSYYRSLFKELREAKLDIDLLGMELFIPASRDYLELMKGIPLSLSISPESAVEEIRIPHGRHYSNDSLLTTINICRELKIKLGVFFMVGLGKERPETIQETLLFCEKIYREDRENRSKEEEKLFLGPLWCKPEMALLILLDPGSLGFNFPEQAGYKLIFKNFEDYYKGLSLPSWHYWMSYETIYMGKEELIEWGLYALEKLFYLQEKYGLYEKGEDRALLNYERFKIRVNRAIIPLVDKIMKLEKGKEENLLLLRRILDECLKGMVPDKNENYNSIERTYRESLAKVIREVGGFISI
ncbi:Hopanoid C-3 methylase [archaeon HR06]|nr:Hopanoid C-3 methylase [archaeon HR06]